MYEMTEEPSFRCPEQGCKMFMGGVSEAEWVELWQIHKDLNHRKTFKETDFGKLPPEILLKILQYIIPDCKRCFIQRDLLKLGLVCKERCFIQQDLLKLGLVCKELNEAVKAPELYREITLTDLCCKLPSKQVFGKMMERSGSRLTKITCNFKCRDLLKTAVIHCGNSLQEIHVEEPEICSSLERPAYMLQDISNQNPTALVKIRFQNITFLLKRAAGFNKPLFERIHELKISWDWTWMARNQYLNGGRTHRGDELLEWLQDNN